MEVFWITILDYVKFYTYSVIQRKVGYFRLFSLSCVKFDADNTKVATAKFFGLFSSTFF